MHQKVWTPHLKIPLLSAVDKPFRLRTSYGQPLTILVFNGLNKILLLEVIYREYDVKLYPFFETERYCALCI